MVSWTHQPQQQLMAPPSRRQGGTPLTQAKVASRPVKAIGGKGRRVGAAPRPKRPRVNKTETREAYAGMVEKPRSMPTHLLNEEGVLNTFLRDELRSLLKRNGISYHKKGKANQMKSKDEMATDLLGLFERGEIAHPDRVLI